MNLSNTFFGEDEHSIYKIIETGSPITTTKSATIQGFSLIIFFIFWTKDSYIKIYEAI
jgi:hypothetical protein